MFFKNTEPPKKRHRLLIRIPASSTGSWDRFLYWSITSKVSGSLALLHHLWRSHATSATARSFLSSTDGETRVWEAY